MKKILLAIIVFVSALNVQAQWSQLAANQDGLRSICFTSKDTGYVVGGNANILMTTDGGNTWTSKHTGGVGLEKIVFPTKDTGYAIGSGAEFYKSYDKGMSWTMSPFNLGDYRGAKFLSPSTGFVFGQTSSPDAAIFKTADGGATWNTQTFGSMSSVWDASFPSQLIGYATGFHFFSGESQIYKTTDCGSSWTSQTVSIPSAVVYLYSIYFTDTLTGYAVGKYSSPGNQGIICKTTDGGINWNYQLIPSSSELNQVQFINDSVGYAVGASSIITGCGTSLVLKTTDAGATWNAENTGPAIYSLRSLSFPSDSIGYCVESCGGGGAVGSILKYNNSSTCFAYYAVDVVIDSAASTVTFNLSVDSTSAAQAVGYYWNFGDGFTSTLPMPTHIVNLDTAYNVCMRIYTAAGDSCTYCHLIGLDYLSNIIRTSGYTINCTIPGMSAGVNSASLKTKEILVYPNPTNGIFNVKGQFTNAIVKVFDITGREIQKKAVNENNFQIDLSAENNGIYILELISKEGISRLKIGKK